MCYINLPRPVFWHACMYMKCLICVLVLKRKIELIKQFC